MNKFLLKFLYRDSGSPNHVISFDKFESALNDLNIENEIIIYENADHAFANPSGSRFNPEATKDAWMKTIEFFEKELKK